MEGNGSRRNKKNNKKNKKSKKKGEKYKRVLALTIACTMLFWLIPNTLSINAETIVSRDWASYSSDYVYSHMTAEEKYLYDNLYDSCYKYLTTSDDAKDLYSTGTYLIDPADAGTYNPQDSDDKAHIEAIVVAFKEANPQFYFIGDTYITSYNGTTSKVALEMDVQFKDGASRASVTNQLFSKVDSWIASVDTGSMTNYEKEMAINDLLCDKVNYVENTAHSQSVYSVFIDGSSVCEGYSLAASLMLNTMGVPTVCVTGDNHEWIKVQLDDGIWYATDVTWNDSWNAGFTGKDYYDDVKNIFANISDATMCKLDSGTSHNISGPLYQPECNYDYPRTYSGNYSMDIVDEDGVVTVSIVVNDTDDSSKEVVVDTVTMQEDNSQIVHDTNTYTRDKDTDDTNNTNGTNSTNSSNSSDSTNDSNYKVSTSDGGTSGGSTVNTNTGSDVSNGSAKGGSTAGNSGKNSKYSNEWVDGKWYGADGSQTYNGTLSWKCNSSGWWVEDSSGWYPISSWQKIDGTWYYFKSDGYMAAGEYYGGYWFNSDGSWDSTYELTWKGNSTGWWVEDISGWWPSNQWLKIDGNWYYFGGDGYMVTSIYVDGYWIGADGICQ
ncbi:MAG: hypothetical protein K6E10_11275 [Eubacterium sp.]|nr:hypothetical protein [Eubacterium sp.]